jgi:riboflavin synthase
VDEVFTGIVTEIGSVRSVTRKGGTAVFSIAAPGAGATLKPGDSIAVNGACQTVTSAGEGGFAFDSVAHTLKTTNLSALRRGSHVNLELALRLGDRISGHFVSGHVDATAVVRMKRTAGHRNVDFTLQVPDDLRAYLHDRGSVALDGVSLTVKAVRGSMVEVTVIPYTLENTILGEWRPGTRVNIEVDRIARFLTSGTGEKGGGQV